MGIYYAITQQRSYLLQDSRVHSLQRFTAGYSFQKRSRGIYIYLLLSSFVVFIYFIRTSYEKALRQLSKLFTQRYKVIVVILATPAYVTHCPF